MGNTPNSVQISHPFLTYSVKPIFGVLNLSNFFKAKCKGVEYQGSAQKKKAPILGCFGKGDE